MRSVQKRLWRIYWYLEKLFVPGLRSSQYAYYETLRSHLRRPMKWLDLGCGHQVFPKWMHREQDEVIAKASLAVGLDCDLPSLKKHRGIRNRAVANVTMLPIKAESFDIVTANMVVEHLERPSVVLREIKRILKPEGIFLFHTPNYRNYLVFLAARVSPELKKAIVARIDGRAEDDIFPTYYRLNTRGDIRACAERAGLELVDLQMETTSAFTGSLGPLAVFELMLIRLLRRERMKPFRPDIVAVLKNPRRFEARA